MLSNDRQATTSFGVSSYSCLAKAAYSVQLYNKDLCMTLSCRFANRVKLFIRKLNCS